MTETGHEPCTARSDWWARRPRRSRSNSKIAGVSGGLAHYLGVDPILFRVGFVALTILGGAGILAYCLFWLLLPAEGDEVSAGESLIGRGRSSVSPVLAVGLAVAVLISITSSFNWGLPFWPAVVIAFIAFHIARKQRRGPFRPGSNWEHRFRSSQQAFTSNQWSGGDQQGGQQGGQQSAQQGGQRQESGSRGWNSSGGYGPWGNWGSWGCSSNSRSGAQKSPTSAAGAGTGFPQDDEPGPFDTPAFWDGPGSGGQSGPTGGGFPAPGGSTGPADFAPSSAGSTGTVNFTKSDPSSAGPTSTGSPAPGMQHTDRGTSADAGYPPMRTTPPAWDPLGAAPFAWDLPDIELAPRSSQTVVKARPVSPVIARATMGTAVFAVGVQIIGIIAGWWTISWAAIGGTALAVVAVGLLVQALRGRSITLVGPGVLFSIATIALALTGLAGTASVGQRNWAPTTAATVESEYRLSTGEAHLDLSKLVLKQGQVVTTSVDVNAGQATVTLPTGVNVNVTCSANVGNLDCLGNTNDGISVEVTYADGSGANGSTINLDVHVGAGNIKVTR